MAQVNGFELLDLRQYVDAVKRDPGLADRRPVLTATWVGGSRAQVTLGEKTVHVGGDEDYSAMQLLLAALAACDVEVIATHATLLGLRVESLTIEARGHFNVQRLFGIADGPPPGYDDIAYTIRLQAPGATAQQRSVLQELCQRASPVGDSLARTIPLRLEFAEG